jgi:GNAT superfamily N-acetyltransferase
VRPAARGTGAGRALLATLAAICVERRYRRMEWVMLDWNPAARFYQTIGATVVGDWLPYRLSGDALHRLAERASPAQPISG